MVDCVEGEEMGEDVADWWDVSVAGLAVDPQVSRRGEAYR